MNYLTIIISVFVCCAGTSVAQDMKAHKAHPTGAHDHHRELRHWEIPSRNPDRIILTFYGNPATGRAVTWRTDSSITHAVAQIAEATENSGFKKHALTINAVTETCDLGEFKMNVPLVVHQHSVKFKDLKPDTLYLYRVGDGSTYWSEWIQFRTAKEGYAPTQFVYFGDAQNEILEHWSRVIRMAYQTAPNASFAIHAGDLVNIAHFDREWAEWFEAGGFIHQQWTAVPVAGNHEFWAPDTPDKLSIQWRPQFTLPAEEQLPKDLHETVYTVDYQDVRIIVLNSHRPSEVQTRYLEEKLKHCTAKWKIVTCHHSIFSPLGGLNFQFARDHWKPLLDKYGVDLVLNGHIHTYTRGHVSTRTNEKGDAGKIGTIYVTSVSGPKEMHFNRDHMKAYQGDGYQLDEAFNKKQVFQVITVQDDTLAYVAYNALGEVVDRVTLVKDFATGEKTLQ